MTRSSAARAEAGGPSASRRAPGEPPGRARSPPGDRPSGRPARGDRLALQEGQDVVAVLALVGRGVDLQTDAGAEQALGALAPPDQVVEGRQQARRGATRRALALGPDRPVWRQPSTTTWPRSPALDQLARRRRFRPRAGGNSRAGRLRWRRPWPARRWSGGLGARRLRWASAPRGSRAAGPARSGRRRARSRGGSGW